MKYTKDCPVSAISEVGWGATEIRVIALLWSGTSMLVICDVLPILNCPPSILFIYLFFICCFFLYFVQIIIHTTRSFMVDSCFPLKCSKATMFVCLCVDDFDEWDSWAADSIQNQNTTLISAKFTRNGTQITHNISLKLATNVTKMPDKILTASVLLTFSCIITIKKKNHWCCAFVWCFSLKLKKTQSKFLS